MGDIGIKMEDPLKEAIESSLKFGALSELNSKLLRHDLENKYVSIAGLRILKGFLDAKGNSFMDILKGSKLVFPKQEKDVKTISAEYSKRRQYLNRRDEERQYNEMVYGSPNEPDRSGSSAEIGKQFAALQNQVSVLLNVVVATLSAFGIGYYFGAYFLLGFNKSMVVGLIAATAVMLIEMLLYIIRAGQVNN